MLPSILISTVGTSLFRPNLEALRKELQDGNVTESLRPLAIAYMNRDYDAVGMELGRRSPSERLCGAEINSIASLVDKSYVTPNCGLFFMHSDTEDGRAISSVLRAYYSHRGHSPVEAVRVADLQDTDPKRFRTKGLRSLSREICRIIRERSASACAINATGGYKAQIAVAVLLGQAIDVPVFYKHELFSEIIAFPPMPVALDFETWLKASGMLFDLDRNPEPALASDYENDWEEKFESLIERTPIDGKDYIELSPTGQIFHETFRERFRSIKDRVLPPPASKKLPPRLEGAGWPGQHPEVERFLAAVTNAIPSVIQCSSFYYNPDLSERSRFSLGKEGIYGVFSPKGYAVKFRVETTANTPGQQAAVVAALNEWLTAQN